MIVITGVQSLNEPPERAALFGSRNLVYFDIEVNGEVYAWQAYVPLEANIQAYLAGREADIAADISTKEALWETTPRTRTVTDPDGAETEAPVTREEVVKPDIPDRAETRKRQYPPVAEYLDAVVKQNSGDPNLAAEGDSQLAAYVRKCLDVKEATKEAAHGQYTGRI